MSNEFLKKFILFFNDDLNENEDQKPEFFRLGLKIFICLQNLPKDEFLSKVIIRNNQKFLNELELSQIFRAKIKKLGINPNEIPMIMKSTPKNYLKVENFNHLLELITPFLHDPSFLSNFYEISHLSSKSTLIYRKNRVKHQKGTFFTPVWVVREIISNVKSYWSKSHPKTEFQIDGKNNEELEENKEFSIKIADIACGTGNFIQFIPDFFPQAKILAFDSDPLAIETARINFAIFSNYDGEKLKKTEFRNIVLKKRDSLKHFFPESPFGILIGNPPWGTDIKPYQKLLQTRFKVLLQSSHQTKYNRPYKIRDQIDIYALFIIQNLKLVQKGGIIALIVPSTILFNPVYAPLRYYLIKNFSILQISYLGEKIFPNVKVPSCILYIRNLSPIKEHLIKISLLNEEYYLNREKLEMFNMDLWSNHHISQKSLLNHPFYNFTIFTRRLNAEILYKIESIEHFVFGDFVNNSRGVELGKNGEVYQCPACKKWNPIPHFKKNPQYPSKFLTKCSHCKKTIEKSQITNYDRIILPLIPNEDKQRKNWAPILIGEDIQPFHLKNRFKILLNYSGIKYKSQEKYNPPKILIRKTGNGIIAALDYKKRYTVQVIYQFSLKHKKIRNSELFYHIKSFEKEKKSIVENEIKKDFKNYQNKGLSQYSLEFLFGIISSTVIEFYYFHSFANPNKKSFPHLIQSNILALPIPKIDFSNRNSISFQLYEKICNNVGKLIKYQEVDSQKIPEKEEIINNINESVAKLFNVSLENLNLEN